MSGVAKLDRFLRLNLYAFAFLLPFENIVGRIGLGFFGGIKAFGILIALSIFLKVLIDSKGLRLFTKNFLSPISLSSFLFIVWSFISSFWAPNPTWALLRVSTYLGLFVVMQAIGLLKRGHVKRMWELSLIGAAVSVPLGFILPAPSEIVAAGRFTSGGADPNDYANLIVVVVAVTFYGILSSKEKIIGQFRRFFLLGSALVGLVAIPLSLSRTALLNLLMIALAALFLRRTSGLAIGLAVLIGVVMLFVIIFSPDTLDGMVQRYATLQEIRQEETWAGRIDIWRAALLVFVQQPFTGVGAGNFAFVSPYYSYYASVIASMREDGGGGVAHNMFLSVMAETGVIGLFLFSALLIFAYASAWRLIRQGEDFGYGLLIGLFAYTIAGLTLTWEYVKIPYFLYGSLLALRNGKGPNE